MFIDSFKGKQVTRAIVGISFEVADAARLESVAALDATIVRFEESVAEARKLYENAILTADSLRNGIEIVTADRRASAIDFLLNAEAAYREGREMLVARLRAVVAAAHNRPNLLPLLQQTTMLTDEEMRLRAEAARELRWALLELEAAAEPPADGPILAGPAELGAYLQGLRAEP